MAIKVKWVPSHVDAWSHGDEWMNEFTAADGKPLDVAEMKKYTDWWSEVLVMGQILNIDVDDVVYVELDAGSWLETKVLEGDFRTERGIVAYPMDMIEDNEYFNDRFYAAIQEYFTIKLEG